MLSDLLINAQKTKFNSGTDDMLKYHPSCADAAKSIPQYNTTYVGRQALKRICWGKEINEKNRHKNSVASKNNKIIMGSSRPVGQLKRHLTDAGPRDISRWCDIVIWKFTMLI